jgi:hypothetical protein
MRRGMSVLLGALLAVAGLAAPVPAAASATLGPWMAGAQVPVGTTAEVGGLAFHNHWFDKDDVVTVTNVYFGGLDGADFSFSADSCTGVPLGAWQPSSSCGVGIAFTPSRLGLETAVVFFAYTSTVSGSGVVSTPIDAMGGPIGALCGFRDYPRTASFWDTHVGHTSYLGEFERLRIVNCGEADLEVTDVVLAGPNAEDFILGPNTCTGTYEPFEFPIGATCIADVAFQPLSPGAKEATITVYSNGANAPQVLTITGVAKPVADLEVTMTASPSPDPAVRGGRVSYVFTFTNHGPNIAEQVYGGFSYYYYGEFESEPIGAACEPFGPGGPGATCQFRWDELAPGASMTFSAVVRVGTSGIPGELSAAAFVASNGTADLADNNVVLVATTIADTEPPTVQFMNNQSPYSLEQWVDIQCFVNDNAGIDWAATTCPYISGPAYRFDLGAQTYAATVYDLVGLRADATTTVEVTADYASMKSLTGQWVTKAGVRTSAIALLDSAAAAEARGNARAEAGKLTEYRGLIQAQSGKAIDPESAGVLVRFSYGL